MDIDKISGMDGSNASLSANVASIGGSNRGLDLVQLHEATSSRGGSLDVMCPELTIAQSSEAHTPPAQQNNVHEGNAEVVSTPQPPYAHMTFDTLEEAERHYKMYARRRGFGIRYNYRKKSEATGELIRAAIVCHKAGHQVRQKEDPQNIKPVVAERNKSTHERTGCPARMLVKLRDGSWMVTEFNDQHNHPLIKKWSLTGFLRSHREIPQEDQDFIKVLHSVNMETSRMMQLMATLYESLEGIPYTSKDMANFRYKLRDEHKYTDMVDTIVYFEEMKARDKDFYYNYSLDDEDRVENLFWIDGAARRAYKHYNDCISFDATYMTNTYRMPCTPFIGIDNHGKSIQFGCGFLQNEFSANYDWLFDTFLICMDGLAPKNIITDQDSAIKSGIQNKFRNSRHRNCRWHIVEKTTEELGPFLAKNEALRLEFNNCVNCSLTPAEFEARWNAMLQKYAVQNHPKFQALYEKRNYWVPAYFMHDFFPFLQTTQRSEGFNAVLKKYVKPTNSVLEFVHQYAAIQAKIMKAENEEDADTSLTTARTWCWHPIEVQLSRIYTRLIYNRFQAEMQALMSYNIKETGPNTFLVECITKFVPGYHNRTYEVYADPPNQQYRCSCCKFERDGILCCHVLKAMVHLQQTEMPPAYILKRWTWSAEDIFVEEAPNQPAVMPEESRKKMSLAVMCNEFKGYANYGIHTEDGKKILRMHLKALKRDLATLKRETEKRAKRAAATSAPAAGPSPPAPNRTAQDDGPTAGVSTQSARTAPKPRQNKRKQANSTTSVPAAATSAPIACPSPPAPNITAQPDGSTAGVSTTRARSTPKPRQNKRKQVASTTSVPAPNPLVSNETEHTTENQHVDAPMAATSQTSHVPNIRDPPRSVTKGRKRKHAFENPLNVRRKETRACSQCGSTMHDFRTCPDRGKLAEEIQNAETA